MDDVPEPNLPACGTRKSLTYRQEMQERLTGKLQLKALAGILCICDEIKPQAAGCAVQSHPHHLRVAEHSQQTGGVVVAIIDLNTGETPTQRHQHSLISNNSFSPHSPHS